MGQDPPDRHLVPGPRNARVEGFPTYWLTDNERTVTTDHVASVPVRHPLIAAAGRHYGVTIATCVPSDPESKGGSEATVRIAKADLDPTEFNLGDDYTSWSEFVEACDALMVKVNEREHRITRRPPAEMLVEERTRLHRLPERASPPRSAGPAACRGSRRSATAA